MIQQGLNPQEEVSREGSETSGPQSVGSRGERTRRCQHPPQQASSRAQGEHVSERGRGSRQLALTPTHVMQGGRLSQAW